MADLLDALPLVLYGTEDVPVAADLDDETWWLDLVLEACQPSRPLTRRELVVLAARLDRLGLHEEAGRMMALAA